MGNHPCKAHPRKRSFDGADLRRFFGLNTGQYLYGVGNGLISADPIPREDITDEIVESWRTLANTTMLRTSEVATLAKVSPATVLSAARRLGIEPCAVQTIHTYNKATPMFLWFPKVVETLVEACEGRVLPPQTRIRREKRRAHRDNERYAAERAERQRVHAAVERKRSAQQAQDARHAMLKPAIDAGVTVTTLHRAHDKTRTVSMHLGPTNSGKTYHALRELVDAYREASERETLRAGAFVYAGPLRLLAHEVHDTLATELGAEAVGVLTGEESINPQAPILCCTAEMAPRTGEVLIVDEAHWAADSERGKHWTELLLDSSFGHTVILGPTGCEDLFRQAVEGFCVTVTRHTRKVPLVFVGGHHSLPRQPRTAIVAFTRRKVTEIVEHLHTHGVRALPLYGALPLEVRKAHIAAFCSGEADVLVTTDVIGHGVNLPIDHIVFTDTSKFDGKTHRELTDMEAAQIGGRAGRFGLSRQGTVSYWHFEGGGRYGSSRIDEQTLRDGVRVANGQQRSTLETHARMVIVASLKALRLAEDEHDMMLYALRVWADKARAHVQGSPLLCVSDLSEVQANLVTIADALDAPLFGAPRNVSNTPMTFDKLGSDELWGVREGSWNMSLLDLWSLAHGPFDARSIALVAGAEWLNSGNPKKLEARYRKALSVEGWNYRETLEIRAYQVSGFRSLGMMLTDTGDLPCGITAKQMESDEADIAETLTAMFAKDLTRVDRELQRTQDKLRRRRERTERRRQQHVQQAS